MPALLVSYRSPKKTRAIGCMLAQLRSFRKTHRRAIREHPSLMTVLEKERLSAVLRVTEYLFLENVALKLVLEHRDVPHWQKLLDRLMTDEEMLAGVRLKFRDVYAAIESKPDACEALETFLAEFPGSRKTH
jgi:hypothetical protein